MHATATTGTKLQLTEQQWTNLRAELVQHVRTSDGDFDYVFRCETATELWRARTLMQKEAGTVAWIKGNVRPGQVFYDIGANIGLYTLMAGKRVGEFGAVYAFEPHVGNVQSLLHNVAGNALGDTVRVMSCALNESEGFFDFKYCHSSAGSSMSQLNDSRDASGAGFQPVYVEYKYATTVDSLIQQAMIRPAHHVKMDVDGNEMLILRGMREFMQGDRAPLTVQVEVNTRFKEELYDFMRSAGYSYALRHDTDAGRKAIERGQDAESIGYNVVFSRPAAEIRAA